jgi:hypothetical protein
MSEPADKLRSTLTELESELRELEHVDPHTRTILEQAVVDIQSALKQPDGEWQSDSFMHQLRDAAERFESSHPTLFGIISRTIDALGQMGI